MTRRLGELLVGAGLITNEQLSNALSLSQRAQMRLGQALVVSGALSSEKLFETLAIQRGVPFVDLDACVERARRLMPVIPKPLLRKFNVVPVGVATKEGITTLFVATSDPMNQEMLREITRVIKVRVRPVMASPEAIRRALGPTEMPVVDIEVSV